MSFSKDHNLTEAGSAFMLGYMTSRAPEIANEGLLALWTMDGEEPGIWVENPA